MNRATTLPNALLADMYASIVMAATEPALRESERPTLAAARAEFRWALFRALHRRNV